MSSRRRTHQQGGGREAAPCADRSQGTGWSAEAASETGRAGARAHLNLRERPTASDPHPAQTPGSTHQPPSPKGTRAPGRVLGGREAPEAPGRHSCHGASRMRETFQKDLETSLKGLPLPKSRNNESIDHNPLNTTVHSPRHGAEQQASRRVKGGAACAGDS